MEKKYLVKWGRESYKGTAEEIVTYLANDSWTDDNGAEAYVKAVAFRFTIFHGGILNTSDYYEFLKSLEFHSVIELEEL